MQFKRIHFIINPAAGREEAILSFINRVFAGSGVEWDVSVTRVGRDAADIAVGLVGKTDLVAVYGGDGSVTDVARALYSTGMPMAIIPGGTANVSAKELGLPQDSVDALELLLRDDIELKAVDMGMVNGKPFLLRVNLGIMADMVLQADRDLKDNFGQLAYGVAGLITYANAAPHLYKLLIDGVAIEEDGVALTVTNSGNIGIGDFGLQPGISVTDGLLDVLLLNTADFTSFIKIAGSALLSMETDAIKHWQCKQVQITLEAGQQYICDDCEESASVLDIHVVPGAINIVVPGKH